MNKFGWFLTGIYVMAIMILIDFSYHNLGNSEKRVLIGALAIFGIGINLVLLKDKDKK